MATIIFLAILMAMTFVKLLIQGIFLIHRIQQLGYYNLKFVKWLEGNQYREILLCNIFELLAPLLSILILSATINKLPIYKYLTSSIMFTVFFWKIIHPFIAGWVGPKANIKVPLVFTARIRRLLLTLIIVIILTLIFIFHISASPFDTFTLNTRGFFKLNAFLLLISVITPMLVLIANLINSPLEGFIKFLFFQKAKTKLKKNNLNKIAITGSYGKTSTKFFMASIMNEKYKTLFTPASYNTPMGISKVINENNLEEYETFVIEMGADHHGDINTLCKLTDPKYGILTAIDIQHMETFGTLQNIIDTKISLLENLPAEGFGIYNYDSEIIRENINKYSFKCKTYSYSMNEKNFDNVDIIAKNITHTREGLQFDAELKSGEKIEVKTEVMGRHNTLNLLASILTAKLLGLSTEEIKAGIKKIKPVEHRLQKIDSSTGVLVLDDAFNANLNGAREALRVLNEIEGNKKIIVTPGFVDLAEKEEETNIAFSGYIKEYADIAILVGQEKTSSIYKSLVSQGFNKKNIYVVKSLTKASEALKTILSQGDIVLFENDLPDTFNE